MAAATVPVAVPAVSVAVVEQDANHITFRPALHKAEEIKLKYSIPREFTSTTLVASELRYIPGKRIIKERTRNGFVNTLVEAYNMHYSVSIRPDDVWMAILVQFNNYVNKNAERLRDKFVSHEGQEQLIVQDFGSLRDAPYGEMSKRMAHLVSENIKDPSIKNWVIPKFSTTTDIDTVSYSIIFMSVMKQYFNYEFELMCGLPFVTLLGTLEDWQDLANRARRLVEFDDDDHTIAHWAEMLIPILEEFVKSRMGHPNLAFWNRICHHKSGGSGPTYLSGWIAVFCVFKHDGKYYGKNKSIHLRRLVTSDYPFISTTEIPMGYVMVDVVVNDQGTRHNCELVAGHLSMMINDVGYLCPHTEWLIRLKPEKKEKEPYDISSEFDSESQVSTCFD
jgi:hypothetical protein